MADGTARASKITPDHVGEHAIRTIPSGYQSALAQLRSAMLVMGPRLELGIPENEPDVLASLRDMGVHADAADVLDAVPALGPHAAISNARRLRRGLHLKVVTVGIVNEACRRFEQGQNNHEEVKSSRG